MRSARSSTTTSWPARVSCWAAASPAGPEPTTATVLPVRHAGGMRVDPALVPRAVDDLDLDLLDRHRVGWLMPSTHDDSHGAGHSRPVNSGKLLVACSRSIASAPVVAVDEVVPVGDQVAERAAVVAERDAAVHAAAGLGFAASSARTARRPPASPCRRTGTGRRGRRLARPLQEAGGLTHALASIIRSQRSSSSSRSTALALGVDAASSTPLVVAAA